eukprot:203008-Alexandrium_andersonii.AAC.1
MCHGLTRPGSGEPTPQSGQGGHGAHGAHRKPGRHLHLPVRVLPRRCLKASKARPPAASA